MNPSSPIVSVVLIIGNRRERAAKALASILEQEGLEEAEVILVDAHTLPNTRPLPGSNHPSVRLFPLPQRQGFGKMRAAAIQFARGQYVASLEEHSMASSGWLRAIIQQAQAGTWDGIGGEVLAVNPGEGVGDVLMVMHYLPSWRAPARFGPSSGVPGNNSIYKRETLLKFGDALPELLQTEVLLYWKIMEAGGSLGIDPAIKFRHLNETTFAYIAGHYFYLHRAFICSRIKHFKWPLWVCAWRALSLPLLPFVRLFRYIKTALRERPDDLKIIFRYLFFILVLQSVTAIGMGVGYFFGPGDSEMQVTSRELEQYRSKLYDG